MLSPSAHNHFCETADAHGMPSEKPIKAKICTSVQQGDAKRAFFFNLEKTANFKRILTFF